MRAFLVKKFSYGILQAGHQISIQILDQVFDRFGEEANIKVLDSGTFEVTVPVAVSSTFFGWMCQFTGEMRILGPKHVRGAYAAWLQEAIDDVLG